MKKDTKLDHFIRPKNSAQLPKKLSNVQLGPSTTESVTEYITPCSPNDDQRCVARLE